VTGLVGRAPYQLLRVSVLLVLALWVTSGSESVRADFDCDNNDECESENGENCSNCPNDCSCECGDDYCYTEGGPNNETCQSCPEDCYDLCVCGDHS